MRVLSGPDAPKELEAPGFKVAVGTAPDNDLVLSDATVSRYHLELRHLGERILVQDLGSTNGTRSGAVIIDRAQLEGGAALSLGKTLIRVEGGATLETELYPAEDLVGFLGRSSLMREVMNRVAKAAQAKLPVLLVGETGSGKELAARAIHQLSDRRDGPFEVVDCGALTPALVASELFGHVKGAFPGAESNLRGAFERAQGGTLFLDAIGELPQLLQPALLGALERRAIRRLGEETPTPVDVRVVSATHRDLRAAVNAGEFRADLYFRLAGLQIELPPLRERPEDLPLLVERFLTELGEDPLASELTSEASMQALRQHQWPGNVRELRHYVQAAAALGNLDAPRLSPQLDAGRGSWFSDRFSELLALPLKEAKAVIDDELERRYLGHLLTNQRGVVEAAKVAGIHRSFLHVLMRKHGLGK